MNKVNLVKGNITRKEENFGCSTHLFKGDGAILYFASNLCISVTSSIINSTRKYPDVQITQ